MRPHLLQLFNTKTLHPFPTVPNITGENVTSQDMSVSRKRGRPKSSETEKLVTKVRKAEKEKMRRTARKEAQTIDQSQSSKKKKRGRPKLSEEDKLKNKENKLEREKLRRNAKKIPEKSQFSEGENENEGKKRGRPKLSEEQKLLNKAKKAERDRVRRSAKREKMYSNDKRYTMKLKASKLTDSLNNQCSHCNALPVLFWEEKDRQQWCCKQGAIEIHLPELDAPFYSTEEKASDSSPPSRGAGRFH